MMMRPRIRSPLLALLALAAGLAGARPAAAQVIMGQVLEHEQDAPLPGVNLQLLDADDEPVGATNADDDGRFRIAAPSAGTWRIAARLIGYGTVRSEALELTADQVVTLEIRMSVDPVEIDDAIVVTGNVSHPNPQIQNFHDRRRYGERTGFGHFLYGDDLERRGGRASDLFRTVPGVSLTRSPGNPGRIIRMRSGCVPAVYLDGYQINEFIGGESLDSYIAISDIEGIEIYRGSQQPSGPYFDRTGCGIILVWSKRGGTETDQPFSWTRVAVLMGFVAAALLLR